MHSISLASYRGASNPHRDPRTPTRRDTPRPSNCRRNKANDGLFAANLPQRTTNPPLGQVNYQAVAASAAGPTKRLTSETRCAPGHRAPDRTAQPKWTRRPPTIHEIAEEYPRTADAGDLFHQPGRRTRRLLHMPPLQTIDEPLSDSTDAYVTHPVGPVAASLRTADHTAPILEIEPHLAHEAIRNNASNRRRTSCVEEPRLEEKVVR